MLDSQFLERYGGITQDEVDALVAAGRLIDLTHTWTKAHGWRRDPSKPHPTAAQVNNWSRSAGIFGRDAINRWILVVSRWGACSSMDDESIGTEAMSDNTKGVAFTEPPIRCRPSRPQFDEIANRLPANAQGAIVGLATEAGWNAAVVHRVNWQIQVAGWVGKSWGSKLTSGAVVRVRGDRRAPIDAAARSGSTR